MSMTKKEQRQLDLSIIELVEKGNATMDALTEACEVNAKTIKASFLRIEGRDKYAVTNDLGIVEFVDGDTFDLMEQEKTKAAAKPTVKKIAKPQATIMRKRKAVVTKTSAFGNAQEKASKDNAGYGDQLRFQIASLQLTLAKWELDDLKVTLVKQFDLKSIDELDEYEDLDDLLPQNEPAPETETA